MSELGKITKSGSGTDPLREFVHGGEGVGKTTYATGRSGTIVLPTEDGLGLIEVDAFPKVSSLDDFMAALRGLAKEKHDFRHLVVDTLDGLEPMIHSAVCEREGKASLNKFQYGSGFTLVDAEWVGILRAFDFLRSQGMAITVISHSVSTVVDDPTLGSYLRHAPNLHRRAVPFVLAWADVVSYLSLETAVVDRGGNGDKDRTVRTAMTTGQRVLHVEDGGSFVAKNRYGLPAEIPLPLDGGWMVFEKELMRARKRAKARTKKEKA